MLIWTYNRADQVERSIHSVLNQTCQDFELILVDNGSTDHTAEVLQQYCNYPKIRLFRLEENLGVTGGMNFALDQIKGDWFATLGDHDEIVPHAFDTLLSVVDKVDPTIDAVTCNAMSSTTGEFCGLGLEKDQYLPIDCIIRKVRGDFFGITKTSLLGDKRLNEKLLGFANTFWYKIDAIANRYYIHQGLKIFNTEEGDSVSTLVKSMDLNLRASEYQELVNEHFYWEVLKKYNPKQYDALYLRGYFFSKGNELECSAFYQRIIDAHSFRYQFLGALLKMIPGPMLNWGYRFIGSTAIGNGLLKILVKPHTKISY
ncbi:MAG: glycosyltransferase family 2 protein [Cyclobacteriaceae bacterium]